MLNKTQPDTMKGSIIKLAVFSIVLFITTLVGHAQTTQIEEGWKKIIVFQTNRSQVEKMLGPEKDFDGTTNYETPNELFHIIYSVKPCSIDSLQRGNFNVPQDTVLSYSVVFKNKINLASFPYSPQLYQKTSDPHMKSISLYVNLLDDMSFQTTDISGTEMVWELSYRRPQKMNKKYKCKTMTKRIMSDL